MLADAAQVHERVDRARQMRLGHVAFERELVEQGVLMDLRLAHLRCTCQRGKGSYAELIAQYDRDNKPEAA
jgi:hypothetical protein